MISIEAEQILNFMKQENHVSILFFLFFFISEKH